MKPIHDGQFYEMKVALANGADNVKEVERLRAIALSERERAWRFAPRSSSGSTCATPTA
jgi:hypothetical protein